MLSSDKHALTKLIFFFNENAHHKLAHAFLVACTSNDLRHDLCVMLESRLTLDDIAQNANNALANGDARILENLRMREVAYAQKSSSRLP